MMLAADVSAFHGFHIAVIRRHLLGGGHAMSPLIIGPLLIILIVSLVLAHDVERRFQLLHSLPLRFVNLAHFSLELQARLLLFYLLV